MGTDLQNRVSSYDPTVDDTPLPPGYTTSEDRKVDFIIPETSDGLQGIAWAVLMMAVADGCNPKWLEEIADFYQIPIDAKLMYRMPHGKSFVKDSKGRFVRENDMRKIVKRAKVKDDIVKNLDIPPEVLKSFIKTQSR